MRELVLCIFNCERNTRQHNPTWGEDCVRLESMDSSLVYNIIRDSQELSSGVPSFVLTQIDLSLSGSFCFSLSLKIFSSFTLFANVLLLPIVE